MYYAYVGTEVCGMIYLFTGHEHLTWSMLHI